MVDKIRVLVVDNHDILREGIRALVSLNDDIKIVGEASVGKEAIDKTQELAPDVIVMDMALPGMDGLEATRRIIKNNPRAKVLVLTEHDNREYMLSSVKAGAAGYVSKRALTSELVSTIRSLHKLTTE